MSGRRSISSAFTVTTLVDGVDGESAPYYFQEWFAWSNVVSTANVTTSPFAEPYSGWQTSIPSQNGLAYLWRKSIRHVWNENTRSYTQEAAQYFRMSGTNGTSIHIKGHVSTTQSLPTTHEDGDAYVVDANGHLYMWSDESGTWVDIGVFQGEAGKTYYTHIAWATNVSYNSSGVVTSVDEFTFTKSPNDTTHLWMGVLVNENSGQDPSLATSYTWSYTKGVDGISVQAQYAPTDNNPTTSQIHTIWQPGDLYMQTKQSNETNWSSWHRIVGEDGDETDFRFAISSQKTTNDASTSPSDIGTNDWADAPVAITSSKPYLWSRVQKKVWNATSQSYDIESTRYIRLTGEDGTSVIAQYSPDKVTVHTVWQAGDLYMRTKPTGGDWSDWHKIVGESGGETDYSFNISKEKISGSATTPPSNCLHDTWQNTPIAPTSTYPYLWMKIQKKDGNGNNVGDASYARVTGELGIDYEIRCAIDSIKIPKDTTSTSVTTTFNFYYKESGGTPVAYTAYYGIYYRIGTTYTRISIGYNSRVSLSNFSIDNTRTAIVVFMFSASYIGNDPMSQSYLAKLELPIYKDGDNGKGYDIVFSEAWARVDNSNIITARLKGRAYKIDGDTYSVLKNTEIRYGYILNDSETYGDTTTDSFGDFDTETWFDGDDITDYAKNSSNIFAAIIINGSVVFAKYVTIAKQGANGQSIRGEIGRFYYYAQEWSNSSLVSYAVTDAEAPFFFYKNPTTGAENYWVFNPIENGTYTMHDMGEPSNSNEKWKLMVTEFKFIITEAIFGKYAHFGSAIINGDWMISTNGTIDGVAKNNGTNYTYNGETKPAYMWFDPINPNENTGHNFIPNYSVDLLTGETYQNKAVVRGVIHATAIYQKYQSDITPSDTEIAAATVDPSKGTAIIIPESYIGDNIYLPSASSYNYITLTFCKYFPANMVATIARICASGDDKINTNTKFEYTNSRVERYCKSFYPAYNLIIKLHSIGGQWCLDCDESKLLAFYDENGNKLTRV